MEFKTDKSYQFDEIMPYGFSKELGHVLADCHLYFGENSFEAMIKLSIPEFEFLITHTDEKTSSFLDACKEWLNSQKDELFLPDMFPEPVHAKIRSLNFYYEKTETVEDELGADRIFYFRSESLNA
jgi:hypothetical protein